MLSFLLLFLPLHRAFSLDAWRQKWHQNRVPRWSVAAIRLQVGLVYFFAGVAKLKPDWLLHAMPLRIWLGANTDFPLIGPLFDSATVAYLMSWAGAAFDLTVQRMDSAVEISIITETAFETRVVVILHPYFDCALPVFNCCRVATLQHQKGTSYD